MDNLTREIRAILIGYVVWDGEYMRASERLFNPGFSGLNNGADNARFFGMRTDRLAFRVMGGKKKGLRAAGEAFQTLGKKVYLENLPGGLAYLHHAMLKNPVLVTFEVDEDTVLATFYTARGLWAKTLLRREKNAFLAAMPELLKDTTAEFREAEAREKAERKRGRAKENEEAREKAEAEKAARKQEAAARKAAEKQEKARQKAILAAERAQAAAEEARKAAEAACAAVPPETGAESDPAAEVPPENGEENAPTAEEVSESYAEAEKLRREDDEQA